MAKRSGGSVGRERFVNRYRAEISVGADATGVVTANLNTGMNVGRTSSFKWVLLAAQLMPKHDHHIVVAGAAGEYQCLHAQLCIGTQAAFLDGDDMQVIAECAVGNLITTSGVHQQVWPAMFDIQYPLPVFAQVITVLLKFGVDHAGVDSATFTFTLWYVAADVQQGEIVEYLAAFGQV